MITLDKVNKHFGSNQVLRGVTATFSPGGVYGIIGENGAGKTTLFRCIAGLHQFTGEISSDQPNFHHRLGFLQTQNYFFSRMTGREYLRLLVQARNLPVPDLEAKNIFDLPLDEYVTNYSTGMQKKIALLGVLLQKNDVLILDEPFNGVDIQSNILISAIIQQLKSSGKTVLISSHIFATLRDICDNIHLLRDGVFAETVYPQEYAKLEAQMIDVTLGNQLEALDL
ncbi:ATP-binding cassette domain-containing protein [Lewinella sp. W8]|uniref:ABC transporter ATP-binding protein n=1 Tax=Lewinella sp. W8 TaxID=2528208 RepID=UPI00106822C9|nr:ATP-binding cassette domain-containing protein [Lewinella sp. W8]MTB53562.1 ATP-binding cassette domain-containing protein [Lewinella sp. W8]